MDFFVQILGSSAAIPTKTRHTSGHYLRIGKHHFLVDCSEGIQQQLLKYHISILKLDAVFITHLHADHFAGLPTLLSTMNLWGREKPFSIYAPSAVADWLTHFFRISHTILKYQIDFRPVEKEEEHTIFNNAALEIKAFPLNHRIPCWGYRFNEKQGRPHLKPEQLPEEFPILKIKELIEGKDVIHQGSIVKAKEVTTSPTPPRSFSYVSDTAPSPNYFEAIKNSDLLYHESTFLHKDEEKALLTGHTTARQAAEIALNQSVKKLLLGHFSARYPEADLFVSEARTIFGNTDAAEDGEIFKL